MCQQTVKRLKVYEFARKSWEHIIHLRYGFKHVAKNWKLFLSSQKIENLREDTHKKYIDSIYPIKSNEYEFFPYEILFLNTNRHLSSSLAVLTKICIFQKKELILLNSDLVSGFRLSLFSMISGIPFSISSCNCLLKT